MEKEWQSGMIRLKLVFGPKICKLIHSSSNVNILYIYNIACASLSRNLVIGAHGRFIAPA